MQEQEDDAPYPLFEAETVFEAPPHMGGGGRGGLSLGAQRPFSSRGHIDLPGNSGPRGLGRGTHFFDAFDAPLLGPPQPPPPSYGGGGGRKKRVFEQ